MNIYLLDTNHISEAIRSVSKVRYAIQSRTLTGDRFITIVPVLAELEYGIQQTREPSVFHRRLELLLHVVELIDLNRQTALNYAAISVVAKSRGRSLSQIDRLIAATSIQLSCCLLTTDRDFVAFPEVVTENWVSSNIDRPD